jgi:photosynthetic reaction center cytochrome c subunit
VIARHLARLSIAVLATTLVVSFAGRSGVSAQQPAPPQAGQPPQGAPPQGPPGGPGGRGGFQLRNVQVLKDVPPDQWQLVMQYVAASLGVQCNYCHVMGDNASDDKQTKQTARKMMQMVADLNKQFFAGKPTVSCASCHNGHAKPSKVTPLAVNMTQDEAAAAAAARGRRGGGPGGLGAPGGAPAAAGPGGAPGAAGAAPGAAPGAGPGRGPAGPPPPPAVTETVDEVLSKYVQALGGPQALQNAKTRVMTGTITNRDLTAANVTITEKSTGEARIEIASQPNPTIRATNGTSAWQIGGGGGGGGFGGGQNARDITGFQVQQGFRLADFALPLNLKQRYQNLSVKPAYETIDGKQAVVLTGTPYPNVTEDLAFDRESGLLVRRSVTSGSAGGFGILALGEQIDYSDYRDVSGVKEPFAVKHSTWNAVTTEKFTDVKINAPVADTVFAKPAAQQ